MSDRDDILQELDRRSRLSRDRVKAILIEEGHPDAVMKFEAELKDLDLGLTHARNVWHSISKAQRRVLHAMGEGRNLQRIGTRQPSRYDALGTKKGTETIASICSLATARNLSGRNLIECDGTALDPEVRFAITEHGRFVLKHGSVPENAIQIS